MKKVTLDDIANELKVSKGLVSLAMRNKYGVSEDMRSKIVLKAIDLGYEFETRATRNSKSIALIIKSMDVLKEEFWRGIVAGIENQSVKEKFLLKVISVKGIDEDDVALDMHDTNIQGVIILNQCTTKMIVSIERFGIPMVFIDMIKPIEGDYDQVMANNYGGGIQAINHLIKKGHKNIIFFGNKDYSHSFRQRFFGCQYGVDAAVLKGIQINYLVLSNSKLKNGDKEVYEDDDYVICNPDDLMNYLKGDLRYTAVICLNDATLKFALKALKELNKRVKDDISVISFDNTTIASSSEQPITSIDIPKLDLGTSAVRLLADKINKTRTSSVTMELNTRLIERNSVLDLKEYGK